MTLRVLTAPALAAVLLAGLAACASHETGSATGRAVQETQSGAMKAAMTPLRDLNLHRDEIPEILDAIANPYDIPVDTPCADIVSQLAALDLVLGPDADADTRDDRDPTLQAYATDEVSDELIDIIAGEAGAIIPYRSWVRRATGAKSHQKKVDSAIRRGSLRRAYLRALGAAKGCSETDAAPVKAIPAEPDDASALPPVRYSEAVPPQYRVPATPAPAPYIPALRAGDEDTGDLEAAYDWPEEWSRPAPEVSPDRAPSAQTSSPPISD